MKAFLPRQKNDAADAKAIGRAVRDPEMRFVAVKTVEQQSVLMLFKSRDLLISQRTQLLNALRGHFGEIGVVVPKGAHEVTALVAHVMDAEKAQCLPDAMRAALRPLVSALFTLNEEVAILNKVILKQHRESETSQRLATVPGIGTLTATVLAALNVAKSLSDLSPLKSVGLHKLKGNRKNQWAMTVNARWRICFVFRDGDAYDVEIVDYHKG